MRLSWIFSLSSTCISISFLTQVCVLSLKNRLNELHRYVWTNYILDPGTQHCLSIWENIDPTKTPYRTLIVSLSLQYKTLYNTVLKIATKPMQDHIFSVLIKINWASFLKFIFLCMCMNTCLRIFSNANKGGGPPFSPGCSYVPASM